MGQVWLLLEIIFKAIGLWGSLVDYINNKSIAEMTEKLKDLKVATEASKNAITDDQAFAAQSAITKDTH